MTPSLSQRLTQRHLETLLHISRAIGAILDTKTLMNQIMEQVTLAFVADRSTLFLHDEANYQLWSIVAQGLDDMTVVIRIPDDHGLAGQVFKSHQSMFIVPVSHRPNRGGGVLQVLDGQVNRFTDSDLELLEAVAIQVAMSLDNARLYEAQKRHAAYSRKILSEIEFTADYPDMPFLSAAHHERLDGSGVTLMA